MKQEVNTQEERRGKGQSDFLLQGGILALASFVVRLIGMIYRIPMVNIIGSEGNGYYSNAFSVYNILLLLSSYSLPLAVSRMISVRRRRLPMLSRQKSLCIRNCPRRMENGIARGFSKRQTN